MKNLVLALLSMFLLCAVGIPLFAQSDTSFVSEITNVKPDLYTYILSGLAILEIVVRLFPTGKNLSILHLLIRIVDKVIPNRSAILDDQKTAVISKYEVNNSAYYDNGNVKLYDLNTGQMLKNIIRLKDQE